MCSGNVMLRTEISIPQHVNIQQHRLRVQCSRRIDRKYHDWIWGDIEDDNDYNYEDIFDLRYLFGMEVVEKQKKPENWDYNGYANYVLDQIENTFFL